MSEVPLYMCEMPLPEPRAARQGYLAHRGTSLIKNSAPLGPYSRTLSRSLWWS